MTRTSWRARALVSGGGAIAGVLMLSGCQTAGTFNDNWVSIPTENARLRIENPPIRLTKQSVKATASRRLYTQKTDFRAGGDGGIYYETLHRGHVFTKTKDESTFRERTNSWSRFKYEDFERGPSHEVSTRFGDGFYSISRVAGETCLQAFLWDSRTLDDDRGRSRSLVNMYYCDDPDGFPDDATVYALIDSLIDDRERYDGRGMQVAAVGNAEAEGEGRLAGRWEGLSERISGTFETEEENDGGTLVVRLNDGAIRCNGDWSRAGGQFGTSQLPHGSWTIACDNGLEADGDYTAKRPGRGFGSGKDGEGRRITFDFQ